MRYGNRPLWKRILKSRITLGVVLFVMILTWHGVRVIHDKAVASQVKLDEAEAQLAKLQSRHTDLSSKIAYLSTDEGKEAEVRSKYHAVKEGESVAVIVDANEQAAVVNAATAPTAPAKKWWQKVLDLIGL